MATRLIKKEDIPDWQYGDVCIKTFSYGEKLQIGGVVASVNYNNGNPVVSDKNIDIAELSVTALAAGIQWIKNQDNYDFLIKPDTVLNEKKKIVYNFEFQAGKKLSEYIQELNKPLDDEAKK